MAPTPAPAPVSPVPAEVREHRRSPAATLVLTALIAIGLLLDWRFRHYWLDDSFITFRYGSNLAHGKGLVYNPGERVEGFSNPLWTLLSALVIKVGLDPLAAARLAGAALHAGTIAVVWTGIRGARPRAGLLWPSLAAGVVASSSWTALWAIAGLETASYGFLLVAAVVLLLRERMLACAICLLLAALTRVEGIVPALVFAAVLVRRRGWTRELIRPLAVVFVPFLVVLGLRVSYYGHVLPNSYTDKTGLTPSESVRYGTGYVLLYLRRALNLGRDAPVVPEGAVVVGVAVLAVVAALLLFGFLRIRSAEGASRWFAGSLVALTFALSVLGGGDWMPAGRFLMPALPVGALLLGLVLSPSAPRNVVAAEPRTLLSVPQRWRLAPIALLSAVIVAILLAVTARGQYLDGVAALHRYQPPGTPSSYTNPNYRALADWLGRNSAPGDLVAIEEAGLIPYRTPQLQYLDLFGLTDGTIARAPGRPPFDKHDNRYVLSRAPRFVVAWGIPRNGELAFSHQTPLLRDQQFRSAYRPVHVAPKDVVYTFVVYERQRVGSPPGHSYRIGVPPVTA